MTENPNNSLAKPQSSQDNQMLHGGGETLPVFPGPIHVRWSQTAAKKGFEIVSRVQDRSHFSLKCAICGALNLVALYVLMNNNPLCKGCLHTKKHAAAEAAGLTYLGRDPTDRHYAFYLGECGHELRRQIEFVTKVGAGKVEARCEICHVDKERADATSRAWEWLGPDAEGDPNYRMYRHTKKACNHVQRIARANLQTGRFSCNECGGAWPSEPSTIYLMRFEMPDGDHLLKLEFSNDPIGRLTFQLQLRPDLCAELLREVPMPTGHAAICMEKKFHTHLKTGWPEHVVAPAIFTGIINVKTEIYRLALLDEMHRLLDGLQAKQADQAA